MPCGSAPAMRRGWMSRRRSLSSVWQLWQNIAIVAVAWQQLTQGATDGGAMNSPDAGSGARAVTLQDVAREADVAISTVSRALSNPDRVSRPMRERIQEVAKRLGYTSG